MIASLPTQKDLAGWAGTTRETVARTLSQLARDGIVRRTGRTLRIHNPAQLEAAIMRLGSPAASTHPHRAVAWCRRPRDNRIS